MVYPKIVRLLPFSTISSLRTSVLRALQTPSKQPLQHHPPNNSTALQPQLHPPPPNPHPSAPHPIQPPRRPPLRNHSPQIRHRHRRRRTYTPQPHRLRHSRPRTRTRHPNLRIHNTNNTRLTSLQPRCPLRLRRARAEVQYRGTRAGRYTDGSRHHGEKR